MAVRHRKGRKPARRSAPKTARKQTASRKRPSAEQRSADARKRTTKRVGGTRSKRVAATRTAKTRSRRGTATRTARTRGERVTAAGTTKTRTKQVPPAGPRPATRERLAAGVPVEVGVVAHWYPRASAALVALSHPIHVGDILHVRGPSTDFVQPVESLQRDGRTVEAGAATETLGVRFVARARPGDRVYRVSW
jgi:hypothetical protein